MSYVLHDGQWMVTARILFSIWGRHCFLPQTVPVFTRSGVEIPLMHHNSDASWEHGLMHLGKLLVSPGSTMGLTPSSHDSGCTQSTWIAFIVLMCIQKVSKTMNIFRLDWNNLWVVPIYCVKDLHHGLLHQGRIIGQITFVTKFHREKSRDLTMCHDNRDVQKLPRSLLSVSLIFVKFAWLFLLLKPRHRSTLRIALTIGIVGKESVLVGIFHNLGLKVLLSLCFPDPKLVQLSLGISTELIAWFYIFSCIHHIQHIVSVSVILNDNVICLDENKMFILGSWN